MPSKGLPQGKHELLDLDVSEVTICTKGMNDESNIVLFKMDDTDSNNQIDKGESNMTEKNKEATPDNAKVGELQKALEVQKEEHKKEVDVLRKMSLLTDVEKEHLVTLKSEDEQFEFINKSREDRAAILKDIQVQKDAESKDVVVTEFGDIKKADVGATMFEFTKAVQKQLEIQGVRLEKAEQRNKELESDMELAKLEKTAEVEYSNLPGTPKEIAKALKAIEGLDESVKKTISTMLKASDDGIAELMKELGSTFEIEKVDDPEGELEKMAQNYQQENPTVSIQKARSVMAQTPRGRELYRQTI